MQFYFNIILNEMFILRTLITWESSTYLFAFRLTVEGIPLSARHVISVGSYRAESYIVCFAFLKYLSMLDPF